MITLPRHPNRSVGTPPPPKGDGPQWLAYTQKKSLFTYKSCYEDACGGLPIRARRGARVENRMGLSFLFLFLTKKKRKRKYFWFFFKRTSMNTLPRPRRRRGHPLREGDENKKNRPV